MRKSLKEYLARQIFFARLRGNVPTISADMIESDGRKRAKAVRELVAAGYVEDTIVANGYHQITDKVIREIEPTKPDLVSWYDERVGDQSIRDLDKELAILDVGKLTNPELFWVLDHLDDYKFFQAVEFGDKPPTPVEFGEYDSYHKLPRITDAVLDKRIRLKFREQEINDLYRINHAWALTEFAGVSEEDANIFVAHSTGRKPRLSFMGGSGAPSAFSSEGDLAGYSRDKMVAVMEGIETLQKQQAALMRVSEAVVAYGGWTKLQEALLRDVIEEVDKAA